MSTPEFSSPSLEQYQDVLPLFLQLVQIPSPSGHEEQMAKFVKAFIENECGLTAEIDEHGNVFTQTAGEGEPLFLNGHLDTVQQVGETITPQVADGVVKSDGTTILGADNKSNVAAMLTTLRLLAADPDTPHRPLDIVFTTSEESGNYGAIGFDKSRLRAKEGYIFDADMALASIITASPYYARFDTTIEGVSSHAAYRSRSVPAIPVLMTLLEQIESLRTPDLLVNIGKLQGGTARNTVIGQMELNGEIRSYSNDLFAEALANLDRIFKESYPTKIQSDIVVENPGYVHPPEVISSVKTKLESLVGREVTTTSTFGVSDGNLFNNENLTVVTLGSGGGGAHTVNESIEVADLQRLTYIIHQLTKTTR